MKTKCLFLSPPPKKCLKLAGVATYLDDDRREVLSELADYLEANDHQYSRGIAYLRMLAGQIASARVPPRRIEFLLLNMARIQRGAVMLGNPDVHTLHTMRVTFHRYH